MIKVIKQSVECLQPHDEYSWDGGFDVSETKTGNSFIQGVVAVLDENTR